MDSSLCRGRCGPQTAKALARDWSARLVSSTKTSSFLALVAEVGRTLRGVTDSKIAKWQRWLDERIRPDLVTIYSYRDTFNELVRIAAENQRLPDSYFWDFLRGTYAVSQAVAVRRQADVDPRTITLGRLLTEVACDASRLSRKVWVGMWEPGPPPIGLTVAEKAFTEQWAGKVGEYLDPTIPEADLADLKLKTDAVTRYVDQNIAHSDAKPRSHIPTFADLDAAVDLLGYLFRKYGNLLTAAMYPSLVPVHQEDWLGIFREPWIRSE